MQMTFIDVDGVSTRCLVAGDPAAPPVLLIHGLSLTADIWTRHIDDLARHFHVVAPDMLGHGFTRPRDGTQIDIPGKLAHLMRLADRLGFDRFDVSGSSYGGLIAANLLLTNPDRIGKLIINGSGSCFNTEAQLAVFLTRIYENYKPTLTRSSPEMWRERLKGTVFDAAVIPEYLPTVLSLCYAQPWAEGCWEQTISTMQDSAAFRAYRILERLESISAETLVVWGRDDKGGIYESAVAAVARMPRAKLIAFDKCGHLPMLEQSKAYNETVSHFLRGTEAA
jgi:2-hydroxy-6-oxonona-2,4-dienedioate hydrolase